MRHCHVLLIVLGLAACGSDANDGATDTHASDTTASAETSVAADTVSTTEPAETTVADMTVADDTAVTETSATETTVDEDVLVPVDTVADDTAEPECVHDDDCMDPLGIVPPPVNECLVMRCIEGTCLEAAPDCGDEDPCTLDACDPHMGCVHATLSTDVGNGRLILCPEPLSGLDAIAACAAHGQEIAVIDASAEAQAAATMLGDAALEAATISPASQDFCAQPKRLVPPQCGTLAASGCTSIGACDAVQPFFCQIACDDQDPCTTDTIGADGTCMSKQMRLVWDATHELVACPGPLSWDDASAKCAGGTFALPTNDAQQQQLVDIAQSLGATASLWAPLRQANGGDPWEWVAGGGSGEPAWCATNPTNTSAEGYCASRSTVDLCLTDGPCGEMHSFGCVFDISVP